jgi:phosphoserine phosphatase
LDKYQPDACPPLFKYWLGFTYIQVKVGLKEIDTWGKEAMSAVLGLVQDPDPNLLDEIMRYVVEDELWPKRRIKPITLLRDLYKKGSELYIVSAAYQPAVDLFARKIAPDRTFGIGTPVEIKSDKLRLAGPLNSRDRKVASLLEAIGHRRLAVALGDTFADIPVLELAQKAIAVHPDRKLKSKATEENWLIIE